MDAVLFAIVTLVPLLLILVVVHELGHFATARVFGVKVLEFGVGFPPRAFGIYTGRDPGDAAPADTVRRTGWPTGIAARPAGEGGIPGG